LLQVVGHSHEKKHEEIGEGEEEEPEEPGGEGEEEEEARVLAKTDGTNIALCMFGIMTALIAITVINRKKIQPVINFSSFM
jgi:hypothetical protein